MQTRVLEEEYIAGMGLKLMLGNETWVMEELRDMVVEAESNHYEGLPVELGFLGTERGENGFCDWDESYLGLVGQYLISLSSIGRQRPGLWTVP